MAAAGFPRYAAYLDMHVKLRLIYGIALVIGENVAVGFYAQRQDRSKQLHHIRQQTQDAPARSRLGRVLSAQMPSRLLKKAH
jgi:hypothetical protein